MLPAFNFQPLPGVNLRIVDPDTFEPLPLNTSGMVLVRGPNVSRAALADDGWLYTGDFGALSRSFRRDGASITISTASRSNSL